MLGIPANTVPPRRCIAETLTLAGQHAEARPVQQAGDLGGYEGFVIGSAAYSMHWQKDATAFVMSTRDLLAHRPVWLFSTGPLGTDANRVSLRTTAEPKEIRGFRTAIHPETTTYSSVPSIPAGSPSPRRHCESSRPLAR